MARFRKKPVMIEAQQVTRDNLFEVATWCNGVAVGVNSPGAGILIDTLEGQMKAALGDWVIRGVQGEFYPCKPDIFEATYDPVEDTETLEAGVVVVPVEELRKRLPALIRATAEMVLLERRKLANDQVHEELKDLSALSQTTAKMESKLGSFIEWLSRLQQNGGEGR